ncbi:hypothetical protein PIB30_020259 [Stylosanthes scabra]|uniref:Cystatin domain-containing protein n=1 Tax=Stylosanthes scabra TaxID=79078 RepID=A0ABU6UAA9_9FABA|nr:hypothetical protein [Stylosanthes scabra]
MRLQCHVFFFLLALAAAATVDSRKVSPGPKGGWKSIKDLSDPHVEAIAEFAVTEYNKRSGFVAPLKLRRIIKGETQVVAGINYRLFLSASSGESSNTSNYKAIVLKKAWLHTLNLTSFQPVDHV